MNDIKVIFRLSFSLFVLTFLGCTTVKYYPANFVESLKHPTKFPEVFSSGVKNIEEVADKNPLDENEYVKITDMGENKNSSMHLVQIRENGELPPHYHKRHDELIYVKKGSGIATLDGSRYMIKAGSILQIPGKTVHKFMNTGGETFIAVSIFSPPFDGRDEKMVKEKRRVARGDKDEKRIISKKSGKTSGEDKVSVVKESGESKENNSVTDTANEVKGSGKKSNKPSRTEGHRDTELTSDSKGEKKSKEVLVPKEPVADISDLHEKFKKLQALKEEGAISEAEYEEKKDALVNDRDIGALPEPKGEVKEEITEEEFAEDEYPVLGQEPATEPVEEEEISGEKQDTVASTPDLAEKSGPPANNEDAPLGKGWYWYSKNGEKSVPSMNEDVPADGDDINNLSNSSTEGTASEGKEPATEDKIRLLEEMRQEGLITEEDYENKKKELIVSSGEKEASKPPEGTIEDEKLKELKELYDDGLISEEDYKYKAEKLTGMQRQDTPSNVSAEKGIEDDKLSELNELREQGIISDEDYELKKSELMNR